MGIFQEIFIDMIEACIVLSVYQVFMDDKKYLTKSKLSSLVFIILSTGFNVWVSTNILMGYHSLFNIVFNILLIMFVMRTNIYSAAMIYALSAIIIIITELGFGVLEMLILHITMEQIVTTTLYMEIFTIVTKCLQILICIILYNTKATIKKHKIFTNNSSIYSNFIFSVAIFGVFIYLSSFTNYDSHNASVFNIILFILYIAFFLLSMRDVKERERMTIIKSKYQVQEYQINNMEQIISIIREEKHDYANHMNVINALCTLDKPNIIDKLKDYVSSITNSMQNSFRYLDTGNDYLDGLLSIKNNFANKNGYKLDVNVQEPFSTLKIKHDELISIVSNLVDNAFQAFVKKKDIEDKYVCVGTECTDNKFILEIANNGDQIPPKIVESIFAKGFSTKGDKNSDHGFGLFITRELVEKNNGTIKVDSDEDETVFTITFDLNN